MADALCWEGAGPELGDAACADVPDFDQYLRRALIYRIVTDRLAGGDRTHDWQAPYRPAVCTARALAAG